MARVHSAPRKFRLPGSPMGRRHSLSPTQGIVRRCTASIAAGAVAGAYAVLQSLLLTERAEAAARQAFGAAGGNWYRLTYNVLAVGLLAVHDRLLARLPDHTVYALRSPWSWVVRAAGLTGFMGLAMSLRLTDAATFLGLRQSGLLQAYRRPLVERGPYARVRHPTYWCMLAILWARSAMTRNALVANVVFTVYLGIASFFEERRLIREFGQAYVDYCRRVPRLFPALCRSTGEHTPSPLTGTAREVHACTC
jgi:methanethiol S-methyltransferase